MGTQDRLTRAFSELRSNDKSLELEVAQCVTGVKKEVRNTLEVFGKSMLQELQQTVLSHVDKIVERRVTEAVRSLRADIAMSNQNANVAAAIAREASQAVKVAQRANTG